MITKTRHSAKLRDFICVICKSPFQNYISPSEIKKGAGKVCSKKCKGIHLWQVRKRTSKYIPCQDCGKVARITVHQLRKKKSDIYRCEKCRSVDRTPDVYGYWLVNVPGRGQIKEHRYIMEQYLGRKLDPSELVHHRNGNKKDNRIENLEIVTRIEHIRLHPPRPHLAYDYVRPELSQKQCRYCGDMFSQDQHEYASWYKRRASCGKCNRSKGTKYADYRR